MLQPLKHLRIDPTGDRSVVFDRLRSGNPFEMSLGILRSDLLTGGAMTSWSLWAHGLIPLALPSEEGNRLTKIPNANDYSAPLRVGSAQLAVARPAHAWATPRPTSPVRPSPAIVAWLWRQRSALRPDLPTGQSPVT